MGRGCRRSYGVEAGAGGALPGAEVAVVADVSTAGETASLAAPGSVTVNGIFASCSGA
jgi:orotate phosphoribosyltransferase